MEPLGKKSAGMHDVLHLRYNHLSTFQADCHLHLWPKKRIQQPFSNSKQLHSCFGRLGGHNLLFKHVQTKNLPGNRLRCKLFEFRIRHRLSGPRPSCLMGKHELRINYISLGLHCQIREYLMLIQSDQYK